MWAHLMLEVSTDHLALHIYHLATGLGIAFKGPGELTHTSVQVLVVSVSVIRVQVA